MFEELNKIQEEREKEATLERQLEQLFVDMFFRPCSTKAELKQWIITYLGIDLPDHTVDENSTSNPMNFIWEIYDSIKTGDPQKTSFVAAASRNGFKTLSTSILEFLSMVHFSRDVVHLSAILDQSLAAIGYIDQFLGLEILKPYLSKNTQRVKRLRGLPPNQYRCKPHCKLVVIVASKESANGQRGNLCVPGDTEIVLPNMSDHITAEEAYNRFHSSGSFSVLSFHPKHSFYDEKPIIQAYRRVEPVRLKITTEDGGSLICTKEHPIASFMMKSGIRYMNAEDLESGDSILLMNVKTVTATEIVSIEEITVDPEGPDRYVYDFDVEDNHNFFARRFLIHNCVYDEVDLLDPSVISESAMIGDPDKLKRPPAYVYISSRKSASGPIQKRIDDSRKKDSHIRLHLWSITDMMQRCDASVHKPELPSISRFIHKETLEVKEPEDMVYVTKPDAFDEIKCFSGCRTCAAFIVCRGRASKQLGSSIGLRDLNTVSSIVRETSDPEQIKAQLLNLKPESSGQVYNKFSRDVHFRPMDEVYEFVFGTKTDKTITKAELVREMREVGGWRFTCGVDFGYVDPAAAVLVAYHRAFDKVLVIHAELSPGYSNPDWLAVVKAKVYLRYGFDLLCPDTADKSAPAVASNLGMPSRNKKPMRIETGVSWLRKRLWSAVRQESSFMILADDTTEPMAKSMESYEYLKGPSGFLFDQYDTDGPSTHLCDAIRYSIDPYCMDNTVSLAIEQSESKPKHKSPDGYYQHSSDGFRSIMEEHYSDVYGLDIRQKVEENNFTDSNGNFAFSF